MKVNTMFPSKYLRGDDLEKPVKAVIESVQLEKMEDGADKPVVRFKGAERGVVLNKTRASVLCQIVGSDDTRDWPGTEVLIRRGQTHFKGEIVSCVEFSSPRRGKQESQAPIEQKPNEAEGGGPLDDEIPFAPA